MTITDGSIASQSSVTFDNVTRVQPYDTRDSDYFVWLEGQTLSNWNVIKTGPDSIRYYSNTIGPKTSPNVSITGRGTFTWSNHVVEEVGTNDNITYVQSAIFHQKIFDSETIVRIADSDGDSDYQGALFLTDSDRMSVMDDEVDGLWINLPEYSPFEAGEVWQWDDARNRAIRIYSI